MTSMRLALVSVIIGLIAGCQSQETGSQLPQILIKHRNFDDQIKNGNGDGLAKAIPGQPVLVNNHLVFSVPGNAALGVAMAVGSIKKTVASFSDMKPINLVSILAKNGLKNGSSPNFLVEPYCYLNGYPHAKLESRIRIEKTTDNEDMPGNNNSSARPTEKKYPELSITSESYAIEGEDSWSANSGEKLRRTCIENIKLLSPNLASMLKK